MIISIAGTGGTGKSTLRNILAERLGFKKYSMGDMRGEMAMARGMTIDQLNALGMDDDSTDKQVDAFQTELGEREDDFIIEGRLSFYFIKKSFKVLLMCEPLVGAMRVYESRRKAAHQRGDEPEYRSPEHALEVLNARMQSDLARYDKWYGVNHLDPAHFDLILDTTVTPADRIADAVLAAARAKARVVSPGRP